MTAPNSKRRYIRAKVNSIAIVDQQFTTVLRTVSLGGCEIESVGPLELPQTVTLSFRLLTEEFEFSATPVDRIDANTLGMKFNIRRAKDAVRLATAIKKLVGRPLAKRPPRIDLEQPARVDQVAATLANIGEGGCYVRIAAAYQPGEIVEIRTRLDDRDIHLAAEVRWTDADGIGLAFLLPDRLQVEAIAQFVARHGTLSVEVGTNR